MYLVSTVFQVLVLARILYNKHELYSYSSLTYQSFYQSASMILTKNWNSSSGLRCKYSYLHKYLKDNGHELYSYSNLTFEAFDHSARGFKNHSMNNTSVESVSIEFFSNATKFCLLVCFSVPRKCTFLFRAIVLVHSGLELRETPASK